MATIAVKKTEQWNAGGEVQKKETALADRIRETAAACAEAHPNLAVLAGLVLVPASLVGAVTLFAAAVIVPLGSLMGWPL